MAARWNGRPPRRRRSTTSRSCRTCTSSTRSSDEGERHAYAARRAYAESTCRATPPRAWSWACCADRLRFRDDLAHLVAGDRRPGRHDRHFVVHAATRTIGYYVPAARSSASKTSAKLGRGEQGSSRVSTSLQAKQCRTYWRDPHADATWARASPRRGRDDRIRFLALPDDRLHSVCVDLRGYAVLVNNIAGGPRGHDSSSCHTCGRNRCCCCSARSPTASPCWRCSKATSTKVLLLAGDDLPVRPRASSAWRSTSSTTLIAEGYGPSRSALPVRVLHAGRHPRSARDVRSDLDGVHDVPGAATRA